MLKPVQKHSPPFAFLFLHLCTAWPVGVVGLALGSGLVRAGVSVQSAAAMIAASTLAFTLEFLWAPLVDASMTRPRWYVAGATLMCACLAALLMVPWNSAAVPLMVALAFSSSSGAAIAAVAVKGIMALDVPAAQLGAASGFYTAGGTLAKAAGGAGTLWLLTHAANRALVVILSVGAAALSASAIALVSPQRAMALREFPAGVRSALSDLWNFLRTRTGALIVVLCVIPFGAGTEAGLIGAIAREWTVSADQLAAFGTLSAMTSIAGALLAGWLSLRIGPWYVYALGGCGMIVVMVALALLPRAPIYFMVVELLYRALTGACYAALLGIVVTAIGKGAASTKVAAFWSLANFATFYPTLIEGTVHDRAGTVSMLFTDAALGAVGFGILLVSTRLLGLRLNAAHHVPQDRT